MSTCSLCHSDRSIKATLLPPYYSQTTGQERMCAVPKKLPNAINVTSKVSPSLRPLFEFYIYWDLSNLIHWFFFKLSDRFVKIDNRISLKVVTWICHSCNMDLLNVLYGFVKVVLRIFRPHCWFIRQMGPPRVGWGGGQTKPSWYLTKTCLSFCFELRWWMK